MSDVTRTKYNALIGRRENVFYFLEDLFEYPEFQGSAPFRGATGFILRPISTNEYDYATDPENLEANLEELWREEAHSGNTTKGLTEWAEQVIAADGAEETAFDTSGWQNFAWDVMRDMGYDEEEYPVFVWEECGRIFGQGMAFDEVYNQELLDIINHYEAS